MAEPFRKGDYVVLTGPRWDVVRDESIYRGSIQEVHTDADGYPIVLDKNGLEWYIYSGDIDDWRIDDWSVRLATELEQEWGKGYSDEEIKALGGTPDFQTQVHSILFDIEKTLVSKNEAYGNSVLEPVRIFSKSDEIEGIRVRIDDKLSRIARGNDYGEDTINDLIGYLVILKIAEAQ